MNVDKESFASLMSLKEQLKVKQEEEARIAAEKEQKRKEAEAKAHEFENAMKELGVKKKIGREDKVFHAMPKPAPIPYRGRSHLRSSALRRRKGGARRLFVRQHQYRSPSGFR